MRLVYGVYQDHLYAYMLSSPYLKECKSEAGAIYFSTSTGKEWQKAQYWLRKKMGCSNSDPSCNGMHLADSFPCVWILQTKLPYSNYQLSKGIPHQFFHFNLSYIIQVLILQTSLPKLTYLEVGKQILLQYFY